MAGLHTKGKTYQARASNIEKYSKKRFRPQDQLSNTADPLVELIEHAVRPLPLGDPMPEADFLLLVTEEDSRIENMLHHQPVGMLATQARSPIGIGPICKILCGRCARRYSRARRSNVRCWEIARDLGSRIIEAVEAAGVKTVVTAYAPVGPVATRLAQSRPRLKDAGIALHQIRRDYDSLAWPHTTKGFFALKKKIPQIPRDLGLAG